MCVLSNNKQFLSRCRQARCSMISAYKWCSLVQVQTRVQTRCRLAAGRTAALPSQATFSRPSPNAMRVMPPPHQNIARGQPSNKLNFLCLAVSPAPLGLGTFSDFPIPLQNIACGQPGNKFNFLFSGCVSRPPGPRFFFWMSPFRPKTLPAKTQLPFLAAAPHTHTHPWTSKRLLIFPSPPPKQCWSGSESKQT